MIRTVLKAIAGAACAAALAAAGAAHAGQPPKLLSMDKAAYPAEGLLPGIEADLELRVTVSAAGTVDAVRVARSSGFPPLDQAAAQAARAARFEPAQDDAGQPLAAELALPYSWATSALALQRPCSGVNNEIAEYRRFNPVRPRQDVPVLKTIRGLMVAGVMARKQLDPKAIDRVALVIDALVEECMATPEQPLPQAIKAASARVK